MSCSRCRANAPASFAELGILRRARARRARERLLDAAEEIEVGAVLVVEHVAYLAQIAHAVVVRVNYGIPIPKYPTAPRRPLMRIKLRAGGSADPPSAAPQ